MMSVYEMNNICKLLLRICVAVWFHEMCNDPDVIELLDEDLLMTKMLFSTQESQD